MIRIVSRRWSYWLPWLFCWRADVEEYVPDKEWGPYQSAFWDRVWTNHGFTREGAERRVRRGYERHEARKQRDEDSIRVREIA